MPRPFKNRLVSGQPGSVMYKPAGVPARELEQILLRLDEFETIRLLDYNGYDQEKAAEIMRISRPTVTRIYTSARKKIAEALTEGKAICIEGGPVVSEINNNGCQSRRRGRHGQGGFKGGLK